MHEGIFEKVVTSSSSEFTYKKLEWSVQKPEIVRQVFGSLYNRDYINSRSSELNQQLLYMVGLNTQAFECDKKRKYRVFNVEIKFHISDEKYVNAEVDSKRFIMNDLNFQKHQINLIALMHFIGICFQLTIMND